MRLLSKCTFYIFVQSATLFSIKVKVSVTQLCLTLSTPRILAHQALLLMGFSRQEYWNGLQFPSKHHKKETMKEKMDKLGYMVKKKKSAT